MRAVGYRVDEEDVSHVVCKTVVVRFGLCGRRWNVCPLGWKKSTKRREVLKS